MPVSFYLNKDICRGRGRTKGLRHTSHSTLVFLVKLSLVISNLVPRPSTPRFYLAAVEKNRESYPGLPRPHFISQPWRKIGSRISSCILEGLFIKYLMFHTLAGILGVVSFQNISLALLLTL